MYNRKILKHIFTFVKYNQETLGAWLGLKNRTSLRLSRTNITVKVRVSHVN
jgi:hypothetical protein